MSFNKTKITKKRTMKKYLFKTQLLSLAAFCGIVLAFSSCANEDVAQNTTGTEGDNDKNLTAFFAGDEATTRTSLDYNSGNFYWEAGDYIYVMDDNGVLQKSKNAPDRKLSSLASFKYMVPGKFTASSSYKVYYLGKNSNGRQVTIPTEQSQIVPGTTTHFGTAGDYGTATATKVAGKQQFNFALEHQPAYLVFQPYTSNKVLYNCYLTKIEVSSDNDIATIYVVNQTTGKLQAIDGTGRKQIVLTTKDPTSGNTFYNGFPLTNNTASVATNGAYMVIKPGTHTLKVRYWVKDLVTGVEGAITRTYPSTSYASNTYYDMTAQLNVKNYDGDKYYMWDAQQNYWSGHEWDSENPWQPTPTTQLANPNYPKSKPDSRYYNDSDLGWEISNPATHASCKDLPNANEMSWYAMHGDPRWDMYEVWTAMGHLYRGGMWFKKKSVLQAEGHYSTEKSADNTTDMRTTYRFYSNTSSRIFTSGLPSAADAGNYFYLPALGNYNSGELEYFGSYGKYWSSSAFPRLSYDAYFLNFSSDGVSVEYNSRYYGYRSGVFE